MGVRNAIRRDCVHYDGALLLSKFNEYYSVTLLKMLSAMKAKYVLMSAGFLILMFLGPEVMAQCSVCTKAAAELGPDSAKGLNMGILYLMALPFAIGGVIGYKWWKSNQEVEGEA